MNVCWLCFAIILIPHFVPCECGKCSKNRDCINGICNSVNDASWCVCNANWWGDLCQFCRERHTSEDAGSRGVIIEGKYNSLPTKCSWLIEIEENNRSVMLNVNEFFGTCGSRRLNIYDGNSVRSPLLAVVSDIISSGAQADTRPVLQLRAKSGSAFIVLAGNKEKSQAEKCGFNITYSFEEECAIKCSTHGYCSRKSSQMCDCDAGWTSKNCSMPTCPVSCNNNSCDVNTRMCDCRNGLTGESCEISDRRSFWSLPVANNQDILDGVASHAVVVIGNHLWLYGGLSFSKGPLDTLARYKIKENTWEIIQVSSEQNLGPAARYGHSLVAFNDSFIMFGGICGGVVSSDTWIFNTTSRQWSLVEVRNSIYKPVGVTGHTATIVGQEMIVLFGYNPENGFVSKIQVFDLMTREWSLKGQAPGDFRPRFGHTSVHDPRTGRIYIHGGLRELNSTCHGISSDLFYYNPKTHAWGMLPSSGYPRFLHSAVPVDSAFILCGGRGNQGLQSHLMLFEIESNKWKIANNTVVPKMAARYGHSAVAVNSVMYVYGGFRGNMMNSFLQYNLGDCLSRSSTLNCFVPDTVPVPSTNSFLPTEFCTSHNPTKDRCHQRGTCQKCIGGNSQDSCVWCESHSRCVSRAFYDVSFPYLECVQSVERGTGTCSGLQCSGMKSCRDCHMFPGCGWCDDGSGTGLGQCMQGGSGGPFPRNKSYSRRCSNQHWYFIDCPACQCNGHSKCIKRNSCGDCEDNTSGSRCEQCAPGYFGDPRNGGTCSACQCTSHAKSCSPTTGFCHCLALGVKGKNCDECDTAKGYFGNASEGGVCYYAFVMSAKTFNLTGLERLSFVYYPNNIKRSISLEISWTEERSGSKAKVNVTTFYAEKPDEEEKVVYASQVLHVSFEAEFLHHDYDFGHADKFGLRGYIYDVTSNSNAVITVKISAIPETVDLLEFFLTFFGCFLSLLVIAGVVWKVRSRYVNFALNRQRREERQKMASRPFAKVPVLLHDYYKSTPGPIAVETCENRKAAVITVVMRLPGTEDGFTPFGQSGVCFASVLGTCGDSAATAPAPAAKPTRIRTHKRCNGTCV